MNPNLSVNIGKLKLNNPVMVASGTFGYAQEFADFMDLKQLGAIVTKTITIKPRQGNAIARTCETPSGMINAIGLENPGIDAFIEKKLLPLKDLAVPIIVSIAAESEAQEFVILANRLKEYKIVSALELNISCPNLKKDKLISQDAKATFEVVKSVRDVYPGIIITKLSPNVTDIVEIAKSAMDGGSDVLALINTVAGMSIDVNKRVPKIANIYGGLSGPAIRPIAVKMIWEVYHKLKVPIIGMGGIIDTSSALELILAGASAISVGTANFVNPRVTIEIIEGIKKYLEANKIQDINELIGDLKI